MIDATELALSSRRSIVKMCAQAGASHVGSSLSVVDILATLYAGAANISPETWNHPERDVILVSKGHAAAAVYSVLAHAGFFSPDLLREYCGDGSTLGGHVTRSGLRGVEFSSGSLGHALAVGCGIALARKRGAIRGRVVVVISDGECDEGSTWEAALFAAHHGLDNLTVAIDRNGLQSITGTEQTLALEPLSTKWEAFNWSVTSTDGHDHAKLSSAFAPPETGKPLVVICHTVKGRGVSFMEGQILWHYRAPAGTDLARALSELGDSPDA